jgi:septum formation inhibitor MinC
MSSCSLVLVIMCISDMSSCTLHLYTLSPEQDCRRTYHCTYAHYHQNKTAGGHIATLIHIITRTRLQEDISLHLYTLSPEQDCRRTYRYTYTHYHQNKTAGGHIATLMHIITRTRLQEDISLHLYTLSPEQDCRRTYCCTYTHYHQNKTVGGHIATLIHIITRTIRSGDNVYKYSNMSSCSLVLVIMCISVAICPPAVLFW